ncbi:hypothetical protein SAMN05216382_2684 [Sphingomonas palmae]|uniref:Uncharacterized protein n=1 Tax=Sphingomonas palmae TaxID=1855283 RepID=A0A1H7T6P4_9SPHN|nr:hypothetical protein [Sphingomonas palmae]SEL80453.1 hypothetical protein SAMN05216382_2684 [Sphingomonas palmae]
MKHWALARQQTGAIVHDFAQERLLRRLRSVLNDQPAANGTPAVDVLATALLADQRTAGASAEQLASLTDQQLMLSHLYLDYLLSKGAGGPVDLPFGTRADSTTPGSVKIGPQQYVPGTVVDFVPAGTPFVKAGVWPAPYSLRHRVEEREALNALGADGEIDEMAAAIARLAPEGTASVLSRLASDYETLVRIPTGSEPLFATLYWRNGVIRADVSVSGSLDWYSDQLELRGTSIRKAQRDRLPGRPLSAIPGLPFKCDARISHVDASRGKHLLVTVELGTELVNCATGTIWAKPDARSELRCA